MTCSTCYSNMLVMSVGVPLMLPLQVVMEFLHGRLFGEGNVSRHLELLGYKLHYSQSPLMEYPFAITNLAVDLRDGLRLTKVAEILTGEACSRRHSSLSTRLHTACAPVANFPLASLVAAAAVGGSSPLLFFSVCFSCVRGHCMSLICFFTCVCTVCACTLCRHGLPSGSGALPS